MGARFWTHRQGDVDQSHAGTPAAQTEQSWSISHPSQLCPTSSTVPYVEDEEEEYDQPVVYYSGTGEFLEKLDNRWQSRGKGTFRLLRYSEGAKFFQFGQNERLLADDVIQRTGEPGHVLRSARGGRTWLWHDPHYAGGPSDYRLASAVRVAGDGSQVSRGVDELRGPVQPLLMMSLRSSILWWSWFLLPIFLELLRFPGEYIGGLRLVEHLFVGLKRTCGQGWTTRLAFSRCKLDLLGDELRCLLSPEEYRVVDLLGR